MKGAHNNAFSIPVCSEKMEQEAVVSDTILPTLEELLPGLGVGRCLLWEALIT